MRFSSDNWTLSQASKQMKMNEIKWEMREVVYGLTNEWMNEIQWDDKLSERWLKNR